MAGELSDVRDAAGLERTDFVSDGFFVLGGDAREEIVGLLDVGVDEDAAAGNQDGDDAAGDFAEEFGALAEKELENVICENEDENTDNDGELPALENVKLEERKNKERGGKELNRQNDAANNNHGNITFRFCFAFCHLYIITSISPVYNQRLSRPFGHGWNR